VKKNSTGYEGGEKTELNVTRVATKASPTHRLQQSYKFHDGTVGSANIYTTIDGMEFVYRDGYDESKQNISFDLAIKAYDELPDILKTSVDRMELYDYPSPQDSYWQKEYNDPDLVSYATGGSRTISFWENDEAPKQRALEAIMRHEAAHNFDYGSRFSGSDKWDKASRDDFKGTGISSPTEYGKNSKHEDFADSVDWYADKPASFRKNYPNRAEYLKGILK